MTDSQSPPSRRRQAPAKRKAGWFGRLVFLTLGIAGTLFFLEVREKGFEGAVNGLRALVTGKEENPVVQVNPSTGGRIVDAVDADTRPLHEQDERWEAAIALGESGVKQREDALYQHYEVEGDPFVLREQSKQAFDKLAEALVDLRAMREEYGHSRESRAQLDFQIGRFTKIVEGMNEKNNRR
ncbi:MAG: hypothetical protein GY747_00885 [Planctomycetes bacterium]|nr:hypothetical protein [Planctomycetota bacterium]MCP4769782.1 hypothetical protein [Planctomycetota bacterium]MCP4860840.1 hypothetical protein [Planctomycetota bacterium]